MTAQRKEAQRQEAAAAAADAAAARAAEQQATRQGSSAGKKKMSYKVPCAPGRGWGGRGAARPRTDPLITNRRSRTLHLHQRQHAKGCSAHIPRGEREQEQKEWGALEGQIAKLSAKAQDIDRKLAKARPPRPCHRRPQRARLGGRTQRGLIDV